MKKYFKKLTAILVVLVMLLASVTASAQTTSTAQKRSVYSQVNVQKGYILGSYNLNKTSVKITQSRKLGTVKSTKRSDGYTWYYFYPAKAGNTTITVVAKDKLSGSKAETTKYPFTILKYQNPVSSVKIRNTNISGNKLNKTDRLYLSCGSLRANSCIILEKSSAQDTSYPQEQRFFFRRFAMILSSSTIKIRYICAPFWLIIR